MSIPDNKLLSIDYKVCDTMLAIVDTPLSFVEWLRERMNERGLTQAALAHKAGVSRTAISNLISGARGAGKDLLGAIAVGLDLPTETVYRAAGLLPEEPNRDELTERISHVVRQLSDQDKAELLQLAEYKARKKVSQIKLDDLQDRIEEISERTDLNSEKKREEMFKLLEEWLTGVGGKRIK